MADKSVCRYIFRISCAVSTGDGRTGNGAARKRIEKLRIGGESFCCEHDCIGGKFRCASLKPVNESAFNFCFVCINVFLKPCFTCRALNKTDNKFVQRSCFAAAFNKHGACIRIIRIGVDIF